eukprot:g1412.t1
MGFCPVPHSTRDQVWLLVGALLGAGLVYFLQRPRKHSKAHILMVEAEFKNKEQKEKWKTHWTSCAKDTANEPNCLAYEFCDSISEPNRGVIYERYVSKADLGGRHQQTLATFRKREGPFEEDSGMPRLVLKHYTESGIGFVR